MAVISFYIYIAINCPALANPNDGFVAVTGNVPGATATYSCNVGFMLEGNLLRTCQDDGTWSGSEPFCIASELIMI